MIDVKKLSIGFLILAVAGGASALFISNTGAFSGSGATAIVADSAGGASSAASSTLSGNAFAAQTAADQDADGVQLFGDDPLDGVTSATTTAAMMAPNNLTNLLADAYMNNLMAENPDGPVADTNGDAMLTPPDATSVIEQFLSSSTSLQAPAIPDWDAEAAEIPTIIVSSTPSSLASYGNAVGSIMQQNIIQPDLASVLDNNSDPSVIPFTATDVQNTLQDVSSLQTPTSAVDLQKDLVKTLVYAKNLLALVQNGQTDPVKTELIMEAEDAKYEIAMQALQGDVQTAETQNLFPGATSTDSSSPSVGLNDPSQNKVLALIQSIAGVPTAHAFIGAEVVYAPATDIGIWANVAQLIQNNLQNIALQLIKNALVFIMQKTIIAGIQGSGAPQFIQQWGTTLANAFTQSALGALNSQMQCVAGAPFSAQLKLTLGATYQPGNNNICAVQYQSQLGNTLNSFYNNFANGGWVTFGSTMQPNNNYFGSAFFIAQTVGNTAQNAQNAQSSKAVASQGFHGTATCTDGSNPSGNSVICSTGSGVWSTHSGNTCPDNTTFVELVSNQGFCTNGAEPMVQTPGAILNSMVGGAMNGNFQLVTSATSWEGLASGLFISIIQQTMNSLAQTAIAGENGLLQQAYEGGGASSVNTSTLQVTSAASSAQPITCYVTSDSSGNPLVDDVLLSGGETISANGATTPSYTWTPSAGVTISQPTGGSFVATAVATGTYGVFIQESPDNSTTTCSVTFPAPSE